MKISNLLGSLGLVATFAAATLNPSTASAQSSDVAAFNAARNASTACAGSVSAPRGSVSCNDWLTVSRCLTNNARTATSSDGAVTCSTLVGAAARALEHANAACSSQSVTIATLRQQLATCTDGRSPAAPSTPRRRRLPTCLSGPGMGDPVLICRDRRGHEFRGADCHTRNTPGNLVSAVCGECGPSRRPVSVAGTDGRVQVCALVSLEGLTIIPPTVDDGLATRFNGLESRVTTLESRLDLLCDSADPTTGVHSNDCVLMRTRLINYLMSAGRTGGNVDLGPLTAQVTSLESRMTAVEAVNTQQTADIASLNTRTDANTAAIASLTRRRSGGLSVVSTVSYGRGVVAGQNPVFWRTGLEGRIPVTPAFHIVLGAGLIYGDSDIQQVGTVGGYGATAGVGVQLRAGDLSIMVDLLAQYSNLGAMGGIKTSPLGVSTATVLGDHRGTMFGGLLNLTLQHTSGFFGRLGLGVGGGGMIVGSDQSPGVFAPGGGQTSVEGSFGGGYHF